MNEDEKQCPYCAELIKLAAVKCKHCGSDLLAATNSVQGNKSSLHKNVAILLFLVIGAGASFASPYLTINSLRENLQKKNTRELARVIDYPAIRENLKAQFMKQAVEKAASDRSTRTGFGALGFISYQENIWTPEIASQIEQSGVTNQFETKEIVLSPVRPDGSLEISVEGKQTLAIAKNGGKSRAVKVVYLVNQTPDGLKIAGISEKP